MTEFRTATDQPSIDLSQPNPLVNSNGEFMVDLNQADPETLMTLAGIGPSLAQRIIDFREKVQPFAEAIEVTAVPGISERMYRQFADRVTISGSSEALASDELSPAEGVSDPSQLSPSHKTNDTADQQSTAHAVLDQEKANTLTDEKEVAPVDELEIIAEEGEEEGYQVMWGDAAEGDEPPADTASVVDKSAFRRPWILMIVGALLGALIALMSLYALNEGTLILTDHPAIIELEGQVSASKQREQQLTEDIAAIKETLKDYSKLTNQLERQAAEIQILKQAGGTVAEQVATLETTQETLLTQSTNMAEQVATLEQDTATMQENISGLQQDSGRFNIFLSGLRDLMVAVQEESAPDSSPTTKPSPTPESNLTPTPTPKSDLTPTPESDLTPTPESNLTPTPTPESDLTSTPTPTQESDLTPTPTQESDLTPTPTRTPTPTPTADASDNN